MRAHRPRETDDFRRALALHREADQQTGNLRGAARPSMTGHRGGRFVHRQIFVAPSFSISWGNMPQSI
jgi:hypothetical protein